MDMTAPNRLPSTVALGDRCLVVALPKGRLEQWLPEDDTRALIAIEFFAQTLATQNPEAAREAVWAVWRVVESEACASS
jgi:hypothetical protein